MSGRIVVVTAGLRQPSSSRLLADRLAVALGEALPGAEVEVVELREYARDLTNHLLTGFPSARLGGLLAEVADAAALVAVTPVFSGSYSGLFKTFVDVLDPDALVAKPVLVAAAGGSARHSLVLDHALRPLFSYLRAVVVPTGVYAAPEDWGTHAQLGDRIERAAAELAALVRPGAQAAVPEPELDFESLLTGREVR